MAGLLGQGWEDPKSSAIMALAGGLLQGNFGQGLLGANQAYAQHGEGQMKKKLTDAQLRNYESEIEARRLKIIQDQRKQEFDAQFFGMNPAGGQPAAPGATPVPGAPAMPTANVAGGPAAGGTPVAGGFTAQQISQQYGIPLEAVIADYRFNDGKKIAELIDSRAKPNWTNVNGNLVNTNQPGFQGGFQPGMNASNDGRVTMWQPDGKGGVVVGAPRGAIETYGAYQNVGEGAKAAHDPVQVAAPDGSMRYVPRSEVVAPQGGAPRPNRSPTAAGPADSDRYAILTQELQRAKASGNTRDAAAVQAEIDRLPASVKMTPSPSGLAVAGPYQATPTTAQAAAAAAEKERAVSQVKADVRPTEERKNEIAAGNYMLSVIDQAIAHPGREAATGKSSILDLRNFIPGTDAKGFQSVLEQIRGGTFLQAYSNLKGGGQITEVEGKKAENAIARLSTAQSDDEFKSALQELRQVVLNGVSRMKDGAQKSGAPSSFNGDNSDLLGGKGVPPPTPMKGMVRNGYRFKGGDPSKQENWEKQ